MNAIVFIQQYGIEKARKVVAAYHGTPSYTFKEKTGRGYSACLSVDLSELKRLVESVDLLKSNGGYEEAKDTFDFAIKHGMNDLTEFGSRLKQAIADYESIYSNDCEILDYPKDYTSPNCKKFDEGVK